MGRLTQNNNGIVSFNVKCPDGCEYVTCSMEEGYHCNHECEADAFVKLAAYEDIMDNPEKLKFIDALYLERCEEINRLNRELAEYKKLEESKKLIKLPCNVEDTVYYVDDIRKFVDVCNVTKVDCRTLNRYHMGISIEMQGKLWHCIGAELIGEVAFFTKEEAEQALERMKEVQDVN